MKYEYVRVEDHFRLNGERHLEHAIGYISAGYPDRFADGSLKKAKRNFKLGRGLELPPIVEDSTNILANRIANFILNGI